MADPDLLRRAAELAIEHLRTVGDRHAGATRSVTELRSGAFDPLAEIVAAAGEAGNAWVHVDGAFGLWAAASPRFAHLADGAAGADSWATDAHKWLNVPYDCGIVAVADPAAHRGAMALEAIARAARDPTS